MHGPHFVKVGFRYLNLTKVLYAKKYGLTRPPGVPADMVAEVCFEGSHLVTLTMSEWRALQRQLRNHHLPGAEM